jgi:hypothetical protein
MGVTVLRAVPVIRGARGGAIRVVPGGVRRGSESGGPGTAVHGSRLGVGGSLAGDPEPHAQSRRRGGGWVQSRHSDRQFDDPLP